MAFWDFLRKMNPWKSPPAPTKKEPAGQSDFLRAITDREQAAHFAEIRRRQQLAAEEARPKEVPRDEIDGFLHFGRWLPVGSSNVKAIMYDPERDYLTIEFKDKGKGPGFYGYNEVSIREAESMAKAASKGKWVWRHLRVLGTVFGFRKPYEFLSMSTYQPKWMRSPVTRSWHGKIAWTGRHLDAGDGKMVEMAAGVPAWLMGKKRLNQRM